MSSFTTPLIVQAEPDCKGWKLFRPFTYHIGTEYSKNKITVPKGFVTDFASVPNPVRMLIPKWGKYGKAACLHDWLYNCKTVTRLEADNLFLEAMVVMGVPRWQRITMYIAVRAFGFWAWKARRKV